jgi:competence protein ComEA
MSVKAAFPAQQALLGLIILLIVAGAILLIVTRPEPVRIVISPPPPTATPLPTSTPSPLAVYVTGAVAQPGALYVLPPGSRVQDAISAAGGTLPSADLVRVNLAAPLRDGDQIHVYAQGEPAVALSTLGGGEVININSATSEELARLPRIGPALADRIIAYRETNGRYSSLEALDQVEGIGPELLAEIAPFLVFE